MKILTNRHTIRDLIGFRDIYLMLFGIPILGFLVPILFFGYSLEDGIVSYLPKWAISICYATSYWFSVRTIFLYSRQKYPEADQTWKRLLFILVLFVPSYILINIVLGAIQLGLSMSSMSSLLELNVGSISVILIVSTFYESAYFYAQWKESLVEQERLRRMHTESQLEGLKNQVNPHFLFNSLNTLAFIISENPDRGIRFVQELSRVYRYILETRNTQLVPLSDELTFLDAYIFLVKERFGDKLQIHQNFPEGIKKKKVIALALQMLIENAIKHNEISSAHPLVINIFSDMGCLVVQNSLRIKQQKQVSTQIGLHNIRSRYQFFTNAEVRITQSDQYFTVALPLLDEHTNIPQIHNEQDAVRPD